MSCGQMIMGVKITWYGHNNFVHCQITLVSKNSLLSCLCVCFIWKWVNGYQSYSYQRLLFLVLWDSLLQRTLFRFHFHYLLAISTSVLLAEFQLSCSKWCSGKLKGLMDSFWLSVCWWYGTVYYLVYSKWVNWFHKEKDTDFMGNTLQW